MTMKNILMMILFCIPIYGNAMLETKNSTGMSAAVMRTPLGSGTDSHEELKTTDCLNRINEVVDEDIENLTSDFNCQLTIGSRNTLNIRVINELILNYLGMSMDFQLINRALKSKLIRFLLRCSTTQLHPTITQTHEAPVTCFTKINHTTMASADSSGKLIIWDFNTGEIIKSFENPENHDDGKVVTAIRNLNSRMLVYGCRDGSLYTLHLSIGGVVYPLGACPMEVTAIEHLDDQHCATGSIDGAVRIWNVRTGVCKQTEQTSAPIVSLVHGVGGLYVCFRDHDEFWSYDNRKNEFIRSRDHMKLMPTASLGIADMFLDRGSIVGFDCEPGLTSVPEGDCFYIDRRCYTQGFILKRSVETGDPVLRKCSNIYDDNFGTYPVEISCVCRAKVLSDGRVAKIGCEKKGIKILDICPAILQAATELSPTQRGFLLRLLLRDTEEEFTELERTIMSTFTDNVQMIIMKWVDQEYMSHEIRRQRSWSNLGRMVTPPGSPDGSPTSSPSVRLRRLSSLSSDAPSTSLSTSPGTSPVSSSASSPADTPTGSPSGTPVSRLRRLPGVLVPSSRARNTSTVSGASESTAPTPSPIPVSDDSATSSPAPSPLPVARGLGLPRSHAPQT